MHASGPLRRSCPQLARLETTWHGGKEANAASRALTAGFAAAAAAAQAAGAPLRITHLGLSGHADLYDLSLLSQLTMLTSLAFAWSVCDAGADAHLAWLPTSLRRLELRGQSDSRWIANVGASCGGSLQELKFTAHGCGADNINIDAMKQVGAE